MDYNRKTSGLFNDLLYLEKDFKYNLILLKVREEEIERCDSANRTLQESLKSSLCEIGRLNMKVSNLERALRDAERLRAQMGEICQRKVDKLTRDMAELVSKHHVRMEDYRKEMLRMEAEVVRRQTELKNEKENACRRIVETAEKKLSEQTDKLNTSKKECQQLLAENMSLRNRLREAESRQNLDSAFYTSELTKVNAHMNSGIKILREQLESQKTQFNEIKQRNEFLNRTIQDKNRTCEELIEDRMKIAQENKELRKQLEKQLNKIAELTIQKEETVNAVNELRTELSAIKKSSYLQENRCNIPEHATFADIVKQNAILKDVIKAMKNDRENMISEKEEVIAAEKRIDYLESLMAQFKNVVIENKCSNQRKYNS